MRQAAHVGPAAPLLPTLWRPLCGSGPGGTHSPPLPWRPTLPPAFIFPVLRGRQRRCGGLLWHPHALPCRARTRQGRCSSQRPAHKHQQVCGGHCCCCCCFHFCCCCSKSPHIHTCGRVPGAPWALLCLLSTRLIPAHAMSRTSLVVQGSCQCCGRVGCACWALGAAAAAGPAQPLFPCTCSPSLLPTSPLPHCPSPSKDWWRRWRCGKLRLNFNCYCCSTPTLPSHPL